VGERPILFSGEMVRAIREGRKTVTRRVVKLPKGSQLEEISWPWMRPTVWLPNRQKSVLMDCPYGEPGDRLWVRETWSDVNLSGAPGIAYRADGDVCDLMDEPGFLDDEGAFNYDDERVKRYHFAAWYEDLISGAEGRWRPSIHMPRWASRIQLEITSVRVERLQHISQKSAIDEGCSVPDLPSDLAGLFGECPADERTAFASLWSRINGKASWDANPWVWVVEFRVIKGAQHG
jgi:hypothetical protein